MVFLKQLHIAIFLMSAKKHSSLMLAGNPLKTSAPSKANVFLPASVLTFGNISQEPPPCVSLP